MERVHLVVLTFIAIGLIFTHGDDRIALTIFGAAQVIGYSLERLRRTIAEGQQRYAVTQSIELE